jgi:hypothetical protein
MLSIDSTRSSTFLNNKSGRQVDCTQISQSGPALMEGESKEGEDIKKGK